MKSILNYYSILFLMIFTSLAYVSTNAHSLTKPLDGEYLGMFSFPLEIGNLWNYRNFYFQPDIKLSIIDTFSINGFKYYFKKHQYPSGYADACPFIKILERISSPN